MNLNGSTALVMVFGTAMAIAGGIQLGQVSSTSAPFSYASASPAKRQAFLEKHAAGIERSLKRSLISSSGVGPSFRLKETEIDADRQRITFNIRMSGGRLLENRIGAAKRKAYRDHCPAFMKSQLGQNNIKVVQRFVNGRGETLVSIILSSANCSGYAVARR